MLRKIVDLKTFAKDQAKFSLNKLAYGKISHLFHGSDVVTIYTGANGIIRQIRVIRLGKLLGHMEYFASTNEMGVMRGGHPISSYLTNLIDDTRLNKRQKLRIMRQLVAQLPGNVVFGLTASPHANDLSIMRKAFSQGGFKVCPQTTFNYTPPIDGSDIIESMKGSRMRTTLRAARRVLNVIEISPEEFVRFFVDNLRAAGKENYCSPSIDLALLTEGADRKPPQVRIIAARMKSTPENLHPTLLESAIALTLGEDGLCKLFRITYRKDGYKHATKLLILEACSIASKCGKILDTDAATEGGKILYRRFGSFTSHTRLEFVRYPIRYKIQQRFPSVARRLGLFSKPAQCLV